MAVQTQIQTRRGTAASWTSTNPTLAAGEIGFETDTGKFKIGNGSTAWAALAYSAGATAVTYLFNATSGQTTFSGADANGLTLAYTVGAEQVYLNGVLQVRGSDYTATNGTSIVLASGALTSDVLNVIAYSAMTITDTYTQAQADAKFYQILSNGAAGKNSIINGGFDIWQRGTSFVPTTTAFGPDRWQVYRNTTGSTASRQTPGATLPQFQYCARMQRDSGTTAANSASYAMTLETSESLKYAGQTVTLSFYARAGANFSGSGASAMRIYLAYGTGTDQNVVSGFTGVTYLVNGTVTAITTSWVRYSFTVAVPSTATQLGLELNALFSGTAGAADYFEVAGVQLELGSIPTPFARAGGTIAGELAACQRYFYAWNTANANDANGNICMLGANTSVAVYGNLQYPVTMRTSPSFTSSTASGFQYYMGSARVLSALSQPRASIYASMLNGTVTGATVGQSGWLEANNNTGYLWFSAEL